MKKNFFSLTIVAAAFTGAFLVLGSTKSPASAPAECEKESMEQCCKKNNDTKTDNVWETLSGQFSASLN